MIPPHGGQLVDRRLATDEYRSLQSRLAELHQIVLNPREASDLRLLVTGAFSPLDGFMTRTDYEGVVRDARLANGLVWTIPITLSVGREQANRLREGEEIALLSPTGTLLGALHLEEKFEYSVLTEAQEVYRSTDEAHPGVANLYRQGDVLLGGKVRGVWTEPQAPYRSTDRPPTETRRLFEELGWNTVVGFQTRNPIHRAHEYIMKCALELVDGLMIHPLVGETKRGDIDAKVRMECYRALIDRYFPTDRAVLSVLPAFMRYAGPREAVFHALVRKNYGCTHFIVGRDHAGVGNYYGTYDAQKIFYEFAPEEMGIQPMFFEHSFFCHACGSMATAKTCPHGQEEHIALSGTKVRELLASGECPPAEFSRPEVARVLVAAATAPSPSVSSGAVPWNSRP